MSFNFEYYTGYEQDDESSIEDDTTQSEDEQDFEKEFFNYLKSTKKNDLEDKQTKTLSFEEEMDNELDKFIRTQEEKYLSEFENTKSDKLIVENVEEESDTDSETELATGVRTKKKRKHFTNDELFYDPNADEMDQKWIDKQRKACTSKQPIKETKLMLKNNEKQEKSNSGNPNSDAVLNCPCCMSLICMDCQRHEKYQSQFRAMFVFNCNIKQEEQLKYHKDKKGKRTKDDKMSVEISDDYDIFKPVECKICNTETGVFDPKNEMYHFFNVLASHS